MRSSSNIAKLCLHFKASSKILLLKLFIAMIFSTAQSMSEDVISFHVIPVECNEDNTFYPGDAFLVNYTISLPPGGICYDAHGSSLLYNYSLDYVEVYGEEVIGNKSTAISSAITCYLSSNASPGTKILNIEAHGKYHYQRWMNETNSTAWFEEPISWSKQFEIKVVEYNPHFTTFIYLVPGETVCKSRVVLLLRYDGNSHNLMQRAVIDSCEVLTKGTMLSLNEGISIGMKSLEDLFPELSKFSDVLKGIYFGESVLRGKAEGELSMIFTKENRYAKFVFDPIDCSTIEDSFEKFNISISLHWSRFPNIKTFSSLEVYNVALLAPVEVMGAKKVHVCTLLEDLPFSALQEPPEDEWFYEQWIKDVKFVGPLSANALLVEGEGRVLVPRTLSCRYNITADFGDRKGWIPLDLSSAFSTVPAKPTIINTTLELNATCFDFNSCLKIEVKASTPIKSIALFSRDVLWEELEWKPMNRTYYDFWAKKPKDFKESAKVCMKVVDIWGNSKVIELGEVKPYVERFYDIPYSEVIFVIVIIFISIFAYEILNKLISRSA